MKLDTKERPIVWHLPEGSTPYQVIDAALAVRKSDEAPAIEGTVPLVKKRSGKNN